MTAFYSLYVLCGMKMISKAYVPFISWHGTDLYILHADRLKAIPRSNGSVDTTSLLSTTSANSVCSRWSITPIRNCKNVIKNSVHFMRQLSCVERNGLTCNMRKRIPDQFAQPHNLDRVFSVRTFTTSFFNYLNNKQLKRSADCADSHASLSLRLSHTA